ncbi:MAG: GGDEF domain-containing protein [Lachnospiraceae bacterium]|nr:GGDEF domain-containing protein [Lachnospiraceae bacterium]
MAYNTMSFDERLSENIKNYSLDTLYDENEVMRLIKHLARFAGVELMLTDRHGEKALVCGDFSHFEIDVVGDPGRKVRVQNRTIAHLYVKEDSIDISRHEEICELVDDLVDLLAYLGEQVYRYKESSIYIDELEGQVKDKIARRSDTEKTDPLTGVFNKTYFDKRVSIIDRSEVAPVAVIEANINDWKIANDNYGDEASDKLIKIIADIIKKEAKDEYVIGRIDGDVFIILIPIPEDGEAEDYVNRIQKACNDHEDPYLTPSIACGLVYKENVEEKIYDKISDAEYLMFENKIEIKASPEYRARLGK